MISRIGWLIVKSILGKRSTHHMKLNILLAIIVTWCHSLSSTNAGIHAKEADRPPVTMSQIKPWPVARALMEWFHLFVTLSGMLLIWSRCGWEKCCQCDVVCHYCKYEKYSEYLLIHYTAWIQWLIDKLVDVYLKKIHSMEHSKWFFAQHIHI